MNFAYYIFLLLIIFLSFILMEKNIKYTPPKLKIYLVIIILFFIIHNITLISLCVMKSSKIIYYLKQFIFADYVLVPLMIIPIMYVYMRFEKLKFIWSYIIAFIAVVLYAVLVNSSKIIIDVSTLYGFVIRLNKENYISIMSLIFLGILMIINIMITDRPFVNKKGIDFVIAAIVIVMVEEVIIVSGMRVFPYAVVGKFIFIIITNFVINGFKRIREN